MSTASSVTLAEPKQTVPNVRPFDALFIRAAVVRQAHGVRLAELACHTIEQPEQC